MKRLPKHQLRPAAVDVTIFELGENDTFKYQDFLSLRHFLFILILAKQDRGLTVDLGSSPGPEFYFSSTRHGVGVAL